LPPLLEKCLERGWRALVRGALEERLALLDEALWTYREESFLPHGRDGADASRYPVLLTAGLENRNNAKALFAIDGAAIDDAPQFERACVLFDGRDEAALAAARQQWTQVKAAGAAVSYWQEKGRGKWEKQA